jgi:hypothetical protein
VFAVPSPLPGTCPKHQLGYPCQCSHTLYSHDFQQSARYPFSWRNCPFGICEGGQMSDSAYRNRQGGDSHIWRSRNAITTFAQASPDENSNMQRMERSHDPTFGASTLCEYLVRGLIISRKSQYVLGIEYISHLQIPPHDRISLEAAPRRSPLLTSVLSLHQSFLASTRRQSSLPQARTPPVKASKQRKHNWTIPRNSAAI